MVRKLNNEAVSETLGTILLLGMAISLFTILMIVVFNFPFTPPTPSANIIGTIYGDDIVLEHHGGESLDLNTQIILTIGSSSQTFTVNDYLDSDYKTNNYWDLGEYISFNLGSTNDMEVKILVIDPGSNSVVMSGILKSGSISSRPEIITMDATDISTSSAKLWMEYSFKGYSGTVTFEYREQGSTTWTTIPDPWEAKAGSGMFSYTIDSLTEGTVYFFKAKLNYNSNIIEGEEISFIAYITPQVITKDATGVGGASAKLNMEYYLMGESYSYWVRFAYKPEWTDSWLYTNWNPESCSSDPCSYQTQITGLSQGTTYYFKAQLKYGVDPDYFVIEGEVLSFIAGTPPSVMTKDASDIQTNSANLHMRYNFESYDIGELRFIYKPSTSYTWIETDWVGQTGSDNDYIVAVTDLLEDTEYIFKAQLRYEMDIIEGEIKNFQTGA